MNNKMEDDLISRKYIKKLIDYSCTSPCSVNGITIDEIAHAAYTWANTLVDECPSVAVGERPGSGWIKKSDVILLLQKWADGYTYIEIPTKDAIKAIKDMEDGAEPPKCEMIQDLIDKTTVNAGAAQPIREGVELIPTGYNSHDCESFYKCPFCGHEYRSWELFHKGIKTESDFECFQCGKLLYYR